MLNLTLQKMLVSAKTINIAGIVKPLALLVIPQQKKTYANVMLVTVEMIAQLQALMALSWP